jgi:hypothetical protein
VVGEVHADLGGVEVEQARAQGQVPGGDHVDGVGEALGGVPGEWPGDGADDRDRLAVVPLSSGAVVLAGDLHHGEPGGGCAAFGVAQLHGSVDTAADDSGGFSAHGSTPRCDERSGGAREPPKRVP